MTRQLGCSFARVAVWDLIIADLPNDQAFESFQQKFIGNRKMQIERTLFDRVLSTLKNSYKKWKKDKRQPYLDYFDKTRWLGIAEQERARHSIGVCVPCLFKHAKHHLLFPTTNKEDKNILSMAQEVETTLTPFLVCLKGNSVGLINGADILLDVASRSFNTVYSKNLKDTLALHPTIVNKENICHPSRIKEAHRREFRNDVQDIIRKKDLSSILGARLSMSKRDKLRKETCFENKVFLLYHILLSY